MLISGTFAFALLIRMLAAASKTKWRGGKRTDPIILLRAVIMAFAFGEAAECARGLGRVGGIDDLEKAGSDRAGLRSAPNDFASHAPRPSERV